MNDSVEGQMTEKQRETKRKFICYGIVFLLTVLTGIVFNTKAHWPIGPTGNDAYKYDLLAYNLVHHGVLSKCLTREYVERTLAIQPELDVVFGDLSEQELNCNFEPAMRQTPVVPLFLSAHFVIFGDSNYIPIRISLILLGALTATLVAVMATAHFGIRVGLLAGILMATSPFFAQWMVLTQTELFSALLAIAGIYAISVWGMAPRAEVAGSETEVAYAQQIVGLSIGLLLLALAGLARPAMLPWLFAAAAWLCLPSKTVRKPKLLHVITIVILVVCIAWLPWVVRNYVQLGKLSLTDQTSDVLYKGCMEEVVELGGECVANEPLLSHDEQMERFKTTVTQRPLWFTYVGLLKMKALFHPVSLKHVAEDMHSPLWIVTFVFETITLGTAAVGLWFARKEPLTQLLLFLLLAHLFVTFVTISEVRYRIQLAPFYYIYSAIILDKIGSLWKPYRGILQRTGNRSAMTTV